MHLSEPDSDMDTTEAVDWSLSQLRMGDPLARAFAALRAPSAAPGATPNEHASTSVFACMHEKCQLLCTW